MKIKLFYHFISSRQLTKIFIQTSKDYITQQVRIDTINIHTNPSHFNKFNCPFPDLSSIIVKTRGARKGLKFENRIKLGLRTFKIDKNLRNSLEGVDTKVF